MLDNKRLLDYSDAEMRYMKLSEDDGYSNFESVENRELNHYHGQENIILIHKTNFLPADGKMRTSKNTKYKNSKWFMIIDGKEYEYENCKGVNTLHFSANGEVGSHGAGNWEDRKYAIIIPFVDIPKDRIVEANCVDIICVDDLQLPPSAYILCPKGTTDSLIENYGIKDVTIVEYPEGDSVTGYANYFIKSLGYNVESMDGYKWDSTHSLEQYNKIIDTMGLSRLHHYCSRQKDIDFIDGITDTLVNIAQIVKTHVAIYGDSQIEDVAAIFARHINGIIYVNPDILNGFKINERFNMLNQKLETIGVFVENNIWESSSQVFQKINYDSNVKEETIKQLLSQGIIKACIVAGKNMINGTDILNGFVSEKEERTQQKNKIK